MILQDLRMAGFLVPSRVAVASRDGGAAGSDVLCTSDTSWAEARIVAANGIFDRATLTAPVGAGDSDLTIPAANLDIDGDGDDDFLVGGGVIVSDGSGAHCARITGTDAAGTITFDPKTPAGFGAGTGSGRAVPAFIYELNGTMLARNSLPLSTEIETLQVEFFIDANGNDRIDAGEFPRHDITGDDSADIRNVRVSVIARSEVTEPDFAGFGMPATANHTGSPPDGFTRRRYQGSVLPRNIQ
jgi:hypothetical protein